MSDFILQNGRLVNMDDLMHSATYVGNSSGGEYLQHWKYIKRVRKNGKWIYYYDEASLKKDMAKAKQNVKAGVSKALGYDKKDQYLAKRNTAAKDAQKLSKHKEHTRGYETAYKKAAKSESERAAAESEYTKTAAYQIDKAKEFGNKVSNKAKEIRKNVEDKVGVTARRDRDTAIEKEHDTKNKLNEAALKKNAAAKNASVSEVRDQQVSRNKKYGDLTLNRETMQLTKEVKAEVKRSSNEAKKAQSEYDDLRNEYVKARSESKRADEEYRRTPIGIVESRVSEIKEVAETGKNTVEYLIEEYRRKKKK